MQKPGWLITLLVTLLFSLAPNVALAKGGSGGGRSYSSGSHSSSSSGRSFSSGSSSSRSSGGFSSSSSRTSSSGSSGRSYSSGSGSGSGWSLGGGSANKPSGGFSSPSSSGRSYSSSSNPNSSTSSSNPGSSTSSGRSFSSSSKPVGGDSFDSLAGRSQRQAESRAAFTKGQTSKATYTDSSGTSRRLDQTDRRVDELRRDLDHDRWVNRDYRQRTFYGSYYSTPYYGSYYHDPFSTYFWMWMLSQNLDTQARWAYNYRDTIDDARYRDMLAKDAQLEARIHQLEAEKAGRDPNYVPPGVERDLMYSDDYVNAVYNPQPTNVNNPNPVVTSGRSGSSVWSSLLAIMVWAAIIAAVVWLIFFKRWGGARSVGRW